MPTLDTTPLIVVAALLLDHWLGEPARWHPLVGFGRLAAWLEARLNAGATGPSGHLGGALALVLLVAPWVAIAGWLEQGALALPAAILLLYLAIGRHSLRHHVEQVAQALQRDDLVSARRRVARIVSRDCDELTREGVARAATESALENGSDALFGALFWFLVAGLPGVVAYRLVNTLDAMWGYRSPRFIHFGWAAARLDDLLNLLPARLTALGYALVGETGDALRCWQRQARHWESPNAGPVMAAGAGALGVRLGGSARYHAKVQTRPDLGLGPAPDSDAIRLALSLVDRSLLIWLAAIAMAAILI